MADLTSAAAPATIAMQALPTNFETPFQKVFDGVLISMPGVVVALISVVLTHRYTSKREAAARAVTQGIEIKRRLAESLERIATALVGMATELQNEWNNVTSEDRQTKDFMPSYKTAKTLVILYFGMPLGDEWNKLSVAYLDCQCSIQEAAASHLKIRQKVVGGFDPAEAQNELAGICETYSTKFAKVLSAQSGALTKAGLISKTLHGA